MKYFKASFATILLRFYLMMTIILASFMAGFPLLALLGVPVFLSALLGLSFSMSRKKASTNTIKNTKPTLSFLRSA